jgi:hypothetical protein
MISDCSKSQEFMQETAQNLKQIHDIQELQQYILIPFCRKNAERILCLRKKKKEITVLFPKKESMQNIPYGL